jgi:Tfp pilus assembly protein PilZ
LSNALGDEVFLLLTIMELEERLPIPGKVVWVTPPGAQGNRRPGLRPVRRATGVQVSECSLAIPLTVHMPGLLSNHTLRS